MGAEDTRTREQRYHDALQEAMRRLAASGLLPERAGQPVKVWAHVTLAELLALDEGSVLAGQWIAEMAARWAAHRAAESDGAGGDGGAWLSGQAAKAIACDAIITPIVTGDVDPGVLGDLVRLCVELDRIEHGIAPPAVGEHLRVQARVAGQALPHPRRGLPGLLPRSVEPPPVAGDQRLRELRLAGEVVVDARLGDGKLRADVGIGEAVVPPHLRQRLRGVQDAFRRAHHAHSFTF